MTKFRIWIVRKYTKACGLDSNISRKIYLYYIQNVITEGKWLHIRKKKEIKEIYPKRSESRSISIYLNLEVLSPSERALGSV